MFKTIATFTLPSELAIAKSKLESEGITCRTLDELTVQSYNLLSNAIGGVKLQVDQQNIEKAIELLREGGFLKEERIELTSFEKKMNNPIFYRRLKIFSYMFLSFTGLIIIVFLTFIINNRPTDEDRLIQGNWCLDYIEYAQQVYYPNTITGEKIRFKSINDCFELFDFRSEGKLKIPGFNTRALNGNWTLNDDRLNIFKVDTLEFAFEGVYKYSVSNNQLIMESDSTRIFCYKSGY
jgi:hypothetical protein